MENYLVTISLGLHILKNQTSFDIFKHCDNLIKKKTEADIIQRCAKVKALTTSVVVQDQKPLRRIVAWNTSAA